MKFLLNLLVVFMPWRLKRFCLVHFYKYKIHPKAHIGLSYIFPTHLEMQEGAEIGHLNVAIHLELIYMERDCTISQRNWITGFPLWNKTHFQNCPDRKPYLIMKKGLDSMKSILNTEKLLKLPMICLLLKTLSKQ